MPATPKKDENAETGLPDERDVTLDGGDDEIELQIVDDTPPADRNRTPIKADKAEPSEEEMASYSKDVQERIKKMRHLAHDERRRAEQAARERDEAVAYAQRVRQHAEQLQKQYTAGEQVYVNGMKEKAKVAIEAAEAELRAATEAFDADAIVKAQRKLTQAVYEEQRFANWAPQQQAPSQQQEGVVQTRPNGQGQQPQVPQPDARARKWLSQNRTWFEVDKAMTGYAYGIDAELADDGITAASDPDQYYAEIDRRMRDAFPAKFEEDDDSPQRGSQSRQRQEAPRTPVAPVRRSASGKRVVTLTKTQEAMAKRLGVSPEAYAKELIALENRNG